MVTARILRFAGVGGLATLMHVSLASVLRGALLLPELWANLAGFAAALAISYAGHARYTFSVGMQAAQLPRFVAASLIGLAASSSVVWLVGIRLDLGFPAAMGAVALTVPAMTYLLLRQWVFDGKKSGDWPGLLVPAGLSAALLALCWGRMINHDTAWYLIATRKWLEGATLYADIIEVNPPLNFYFTAPAIWLANLSGLSDTNAQYAILALVFFVCLRWSATLLLRQGLSAARRMVVLVGLAVALVLPALDNLAQREHLLVILLTPWLLGRLAPQSRQSDVLQTVVASVAICLKPFFLLFPLAVTVRDVIATRSLRPVLSASNLVMLIVGGGYVTFVALFHPAYFSDIVPMARDVYGAYGVGFGDVLGAVALPALLYGLAAFVVLRRKAEPATTLFASAALAGLGCYLWQGTGFGYHAIPFQCFALMGFLWPLTSARTPAAARLAVLVLAATAGLVSLPRGFYSNAAVAEIVRAAAPGGGAARLMVLSTYVHAGPPVAIALGADWTSRFPAAWLVPGAVDGLAAAECRAAPEDCARLRAIADRARGDMIEDLERTEPDLLVVDRRPGYFHVTDFSWYAFMSLDRRWPQILSLYDRVATTDHFDVWRLRNRAAATGQD